MESPWELACALFPDYILSSFHYSVGVVALFAVTCKVSALMQPWHRPVFVFTFSYHDYISHSNMRVLTVYLYDILNIYTVYITSYGACNSVEFCRRIHWLLAYRTQRLTY